MACACRKEHELFPSIMPCLCIFQMAKLPLAGDRTNRQSICRELWRPSDGKSWGRVGCSMASNFIRIGLAATAISARRFSRESNWDQGIVIIKQHGKHHSARHERLSKAWFSFSLFLVETCERPETICFAYLHRRPTRPPSIAKARWFPID